MPERILVVDDERNLRLTLREILAGHGFEIAEAENGKAALEALRQCAPDLVLCDWKMPGTDGEYLLRGLRDLGSPQWLPVIVMTAHGTGQNAMTAIQLGAYDFITKPLDMDELLATVKRALHHVNLQHEVDDLRAERSGKLLKEDGETEQMIGSSRPMLDLFKAVGRVAATDTSVLILGESGSGKELVARTIHRQSRRATGPFVVVNCAALPAELLESELFGHEKGAFTGAHSRRAGKFESASGGTVFLDEIGELPLALQPKLLRVLQEHTFERLGNSETIAADFRLVAATNRSLLEEVEEKRFRADLYYRLQVFTVTVPPLRERRTDILPLAEHFLRQFAERNGFSPSAFSDDAVLVLQQSSFPGNVRELEHLIEHAAVLAAGRVVTCEILHQSMLQPPEREAPSDLAQLLRMPFHESVAAWERKLVENALNDSGGNKADAARRLGIQRRLLYEKMKALGIESSDQQEYDPTFGA
jgi:DNA-binding NtrC family response regulator